jgi:pimeloyl-ACP methyl ester carboxylesterase
MPVNQVGSALAFFAAAHRALARAGCERHLVVGHSLGGALAAVIASTVTWVPVRGVTFNAPGLGEFQARGGNGASDLDLPRANADNVMNFRSASDIVSHWGLHIGKTYDVPGTRRHGIRAMMRVLTRRTWEAGACNSATAQARPPVSVTTIDPTLTKAIATHRAGRLPEAKAQYERVLRRRPNDPDALNFLGMLEHQNGNPRAASSCCSAR